MDPTGNEQQKSPFVRRGLSAELVNELFGSLPFGNGFRLLTKMPNGLLARNVQKMLKNIRMAIKENKLDEVNCDSKISEDGLIAATSIDFVAYNTVRTILPIPSFKLWDPIKPTIVSYFEMQILCQPAEGCNSVGFECPYSCPDSSWLFFSIEILHKGGMEIGGMQNDPIDKKSFYNFENGDEDFVEGDFVGLGIIHHPDRKMECFATCNDKLLGKVTLPPVYQNAELYPAASLARLGNSIRLNFGKDEWQFKEFGLVL